MYVSEAFPKLNPMTYLPFVYQTAHAIDLSVQFESPKVLPSVFDSCDGHDNTDWDHRHPRFKCIDHRHKIEYCNAHKI